MIGSMLLLFASSCFAVPSAIDEAPQQNSATPKSNSISYPQFSILGSWTYRLPNASCVENFEFLADGKMRGTSAKQVVDSQYSISDDHTQYAFYKLTHKVVVANEEKDCDGEIAKVGYEATHFVRYDTSGDKMVMCDDENALLESCFGPLIRNK